MDNIFHAGAMEFIVEVLVKGGKQFMIGKTDEDAITYNHIEINLKVITLDQIVIFLLLQF